MLSIFNRKSARQAARTLEKFLKAKGFELKHGEAMDALAAMSGNGNWAALAKTLTPEVVDRELKDFELAHAWDSAECELRAEESGADGYGPEWALVVHTGFQLRYNADGELLEYVRVCDPLGRECMYWHYKEWEEDPQVVIGAILGALDRGRPVIVNKKADHEPTPMAAHREKTPSLKDLNFFDVSAVSIDGHYMRFRYVEEAVVARLGDPEGDEDSECETAVELWREDDGLLYEERLTLEELRKMAWNAEKRCFIGMDGAAYEFFIERAFGA